MYCNVVKIYDNEVVIINKKLYLRVDYKVQGSDNIYSYVFHLGFSTDYSEQTINRLLNERLFIGDVGKRFLEVTDYRFSEKPTLWDNRHPIVEKIEAYIKKISKASWVVRSDEEYLSFCIKCTLEISDGNVIRQKVGYLAGDKYHLMIDANGVETDEYVLSVLYELKRYGILPAERVMFYVAGGFLVFVEVLG